MAIEVADNTEDDTNWAFAYAEERKLRMELQTRLLGLSACVATLVNASERTIDYVLDMDPEKKASKIEGGLVECLSKLSSEAFDAEMINDTLVYDPPWGGMTREIQDAYTVPRDERTPTQSRILETYLKKHATMLKDGWDACLEHWTKICERDDLRSPIEAKSHHTQKFITRALVKGLAMMAASKRSKEDGKDESATTH